MRVAAMATPALGLGLQPAGARLLTNSSGVSVDPDWRTYEVSTTVKVLRPVGETRVWLPQPLVRDTAFQKTLAHSVQCEAGRTFSFEEPRTGLNILGAVFPPGSVPAIKTSARVTTRNRSVNLNGLNESFTRSRHRIPADVTAFLKPTRYVPTDGIVKATADKITSGARTDVEKTRAIYDWIVKNTYRDPKVHGCGVGDIKPMLETGALRGKCADINALFVGLVKSSGLPARAV